MEATLFENENLYGEDNSPKDETEITTTILYFSKDELEEFKGLCKAGMKKEFGEEFANVGNLSDLLLICLRKNYKPNENN